MLSTSNVVTVLLVMGALLRTLLVSIVHKLISYIIGLAMLGISKHHKQPWKHYIVGGWSLIFVYINMAVMPAAVSNHRMGCDNINIVSPGLSVIPRPTGHRYYHAIPWWHPILKYNHGVIWFSLVLYDYYTVSHGILKVIPTYSYILWNRKVPCLPSVTGFSSKLVFNHSTL